MIYSTIVPIRATPLSASQSDILLRGDTLQKEETIFPQFVNWQSPKDMTKIMLQTDPDCYFHSEGFNARVCLHAKNIFIYLLYWSGHIDQKPQPALLSYTLQHYYRLFKNCFIQPRDGGFPGSEGKSSTSSL